MDLNKHGHEITEEEFKTIPILSFTEFRAYMKDDEEFQNRRNELDEDEEVTEIKKIYDKYGLNFNHWWGNKIIFLPDDHPWIENRINQVKL